MFLIAILCTDVYLKYICISIYMICFISLGKNTVTKVMFILINVLKIKKFLILRYKVLIYYLNVS